MPDDATVESIAGAFMASAGHHMRDLSATERREVCEQAARAAIQVMPMPAATFAEKARELSKLAEAMKGGE